MTSEAMDGGGMGSTCKAGAAGKVSMSKGSIQGQEAGGSHAAGVHSEGAFSPHRAARASVRGCPLFLLHLCPAVAATGVLGQDAATGVLVLGSLSPLS